MPLFFSMSLAGSIPLCIGLLVMILQKEQTNFYYVNSLFKLSVILYLLPLQLIKNMIPVTHNFFTIDNNYTYILSLKNKLQLHFHDKTILVPFWMFFLLLIVTGVRDGRFRADLYHRLSVFSVYVPPLRDMEDDKLLLLEHFRQRYASQLQQPPFTLSAEAVALWQRYSFPGNVRELRNIVIRLSAKFPGQLVDCTMLEAELDLQDENGELPPPSLPTSETLNDALIVAAQERLQGPEPFSLSQLLAETERSYIESALRLAHGNVSRAARLLGINRTTLYNRMESLARERQNNVP